MTCGFAQGAMLAGQRIEVPGGKKIPSPLLQPVERRRLMLTWGNLPARA